MAKKNNFRLTPAMAITLMILIVMLAVFFSKQTSPTGNFQTGPTIADTGGVCIPNGETRCAVSNIPCCAPASCVTRIAQAYIPWGVCKNPVSAAN